MNYTSEVMQESFQKWYKEKKKRKIFNETYHTYHSGNLSIIERTTY